jgi:hypothetical protein
MIAEWIRTVTTPCPRHLRAMGYLRESVGLAARARRLAADWASHAEASRAFIAEAARSSHGRGRVVVLGSGPLIDIPLDVLAEAFDDVVLVDVLHPPGSRRLAGRYPNVRRQSIDVTGIVRAVHDQIAAGDTSSLPTPAETLPGPECDLVVSANLLSQLPLLPRLYLRERTARPEDEVEAFATAIVRAHLAALADASGRACLISDNQVLYVDGDRLLGDEDPLHGVDIGFGDRSWTWDFAPRPEHQPDIDVRHRIVGIADYRG